MQALNIPTKINKGTVEITTDVQLIRIGEKVRLCICLLTGPRICLRPVALPLFSLHACRCIVQEGQCLAMCHCSSGR